METISAQNREIIDLKLMLDLFNAITLVTLDEFILDVIKDPSMRIKLVISKFEHDKVYHNMCVPIREIRNMRNKVIHHATIMDQDIISYLKCVKTLKLYLVDIGNATCNCAILCDKILGVNIQPINVAEPIDFNTIAQNVIQREDLKGRIIVPAFGKFAGEKVIFKGWNGSNVLIIAGGLPKNLYMTMKFTY